MPQPVEYNPANSNKCSIPKSFDNINFKWGKISTFKYLNNYFKIFKFRPVESEIGQEILIFQKIMLGFEKYFAKIIFQKIIGKHFGKVYENSCKNEFFQNKFSK